MLGEFPMGRHWAASLFAAVLPQSRIGNIHVGHRDQVAAQLERAVWLRGASLGDVMARVKAAYALLDMAFEQASERMALIVDQTFVRLEELQEREFHHQNTIEATSKDDLEAKFGTYLALYAFTYDQYFRSLAAPLVVADAVTRTGEADSALVDQDGRARTARLPDLEHERGVKAGIFSDGLERHLRNSAAHHRYTILGDDSIRLWDVDEHSGKTTWGPVDWKFWDLRTSVYKLSNSCSVLLLALGMFDIAHGRTIKERGWGIRGRPRPKRRDIAKSELLTMADLHGFTVEAVAVAADGALAVSLIVKGETVIDQTVQIMAGGHGARSFLEQKVRTEWAAPQPSLWLPSNHAGRARRLRRSSRRRDGAGP